MDLGTASKPQYNICLLKTINASNTLVQLLEKYESIHGRPPLCRREPGEEWKAAWGEERSGRDWDKKRDGKLQPS